MLYPMFLQLFLFGGGPLREWTHALKIQIHTHTHARNCLSPPLVVQVVFLLQSDPSVHTPLIKVRRANKPGRLPDMPGPLPTCWVQKTPLNLSISLAQRVSPALHGFCVLVKAQRLERGLEANSFLITTHHRPCQCKGLLMLPVETTVTSHFYLATGILFLPISSQQ